MCRREWPPGDGDGQGSEKEPTMLHNIRTAVVGAGFIGPVHVEALRRLGVTITGILGRR